MGGGGGGRDIVYIYTHTHIYIYEFLAQEVVVMAIPLLISPFNTLLHL